MLCRLEPFQCFTDNSVIKLNEKWKFVELRKCKYMFLYIIRKRVITLYLYDILDYTRAFMTSHFSLKSEYGLTFLSREYL